MKSKRLSREIQAMVSGGTVLLQIAIALVAAIMGKGGTASHVHGLAKPEGKNIIDRMAEVVVSTVVQVAWDMVLKWIIAACRFTSYLSPSITGKNFPFQAGDLDIGKDVLTIRITLPRLSTPDVLKYLDEQGLRPATLMELLWWWLTHPTKQANCLVVALGSVWGGCAPYVYGVGEDRRLTFGDLATGWCMDCTFAAVRK